MTQSNQPSTICFIGSGNMATSMIGGLVAKNYPPDRIIASDIDKAKLHQLESDFHIQTIQDNNAALASADIVILAVKPQVLQAVCKSLELNHSPLFISIAAGVLATDIDRWLGHNRSIVRCMPNTPALLGLGASALFANTRVNAQQKQSAEKILQSTGITVWVEQESQLDAVTAISGSGPAYFFLFIEALEKAAVSLGLDPDIAARLARQTALGASTMAQDEDVTQLRQQVTSKGGTTEQAIQSFQRNQLDKIVLEATQAAARRSQQLAEELGQ